MVGGRDFLACSLVVNNAMKIAEKNVCSPVAFIDRLMAGISNTVAFLILHWANYTPDTDLLIDGGLSATLYFT